MTLKGNCPKKRGHGSKGSIASSHRGLKQRNPSEHSEACDPDGHGAWHRWDMRGVR